MKTKAWLLGAVNFHVLTGALAAAPSLTTRQDDDVHLSERDAKLLHAASLSTSGGLDVAGRKLADSCDSYPITSGSTTNNIQWVGKGGDDTEWLNVDNWATAHLPGTNKFNKLIMSTVYDRGTVHCPVTYMTHNVLLELRTYASLDVQADLKIGDQLLLKSEAKLTQSGSSVVTVGKRLVLSANYEISGNSKLVVGTSIYFSIPGDLKIKGESTSISVSPDAPNNDSEVHGLLTYVMGASGVGSLTFNGELTIGTAARISVDASLYSGGQAMLPLITFTSSVGVFDPSHVSTAPVVKGLADGLTAEIMTSDNGVYLKISQNGVPPPPAPTAEPPSPVATAPPTKQPSPSPTVPATASPTSAPVTPQTPAPVPLPTSAPVTPQTSAPVPLPTSAPVTPQTPAPVPLPTSAPVTPQTPAPVPLTTSAPVTPQTPAPVPLPTSAPVTPQTPAPVPLPTSAPVSTPTTPAPISSSTTYVTMGKVGVANVVPAQDCPSEVTNELVIDGNDYEGGEGTFTLFECYTGVGFDVMKIRLVNFEKHHGLWFEIKKNMGNVELMIKSLANYSEYLFNNEYKGQYNFQAVDNQDHFPGFSWDNVSKWVSYKIKGRDKRMSNEMINWIADNNYISWYGLLSDFDLIDTARRLRTRNPDYKQILYWNSYGLWWKLIGSAYDPYPGFKNEWYKRENGMYVTDKNGNRRIYDHSNPEFRKWWIDHALRMNANEWISGVFTDATRSDELSDHSKMIEDLQNKLPHDAIKLGNFLRQVDSGRDGNRWRMNYTDGSYLEGVHHGLPPQKDEYGDGQPLIVSMQLAREALWKGKIIMWNGAPFNCNLFGVEPIDRSKGRCEADFTQQQLHEFIQPTLAEYLIVVEEFAYFNFMVTQVATKDKRHLWETSQMPEFQNRLGRPLGPPVKVGNKFIRHFEHVRVMLTVGADGVNQGTLEWDSA